MVGLNFVKVTFRYENNHLSAGPCGSWVFSCSAHNAK